MNFTMILGDVAAVVGSGMALSPLLQARQIRRTGSSGDVSVTAMWIFVVNSCAWLAYGAALGNVVLILPNAVALGALTVAITVAMRYRGAPSGSEVAEPTDRPAGRERIAHAAATR